MGTPNWHRATIAQQKECGWKDGDRGGAARTQGTQRKEEEKTDLTLTGLLMEGLRVASHAAGARPQRKHFGTNRKASIDWQQAKPGDFA